MAKNWHKSIVSNSEIELVSKAIADAEAKTSGELVAVIVRRSSVTGQLQGVIALILFLLMFAGIELNRSLHLYFSWHQEWWAAYGYGLAMISILLGTYWIAGLLALNPLIQRVLIPKADKNCQVDQRALAEFNLAKIQNTAKGTGILIFLSLMEKRAVVLADKGIAEKLPPETWHEIVALLLTGIRKGKPAQGLITAIDRCGNLLSQHFPLGPNDTNELSNQLIIKE